MLLNGGAFSPASANHLLVSLNGVIQKPGSSFTISGSQITFVPSSGTLSNSDNIDFIMALGDVLNIGTPTDGTVTSAKLDTNIAKSGNLDVGTIRSANGTSAMTINSSGLILPKMPILQVSATDTDQSMSAGTNTKVQWETVEIDTLSGWSTSNHRYTPTVAGYYLVGGTIRAGLTGVNDFVSIAVSKNGFDTNDAVDMLRQQFNHQSDTLESGSLPIPTVLIQMNGSGDYIEVYFKTDEACELHNTAAPKSFFFAKLVHAT